MAFFSLALRVFYEELNWVYRRWIWSQKSFFTIGTVRGVTWAFRIVVVSVVGFVGVILDRLEVFVRNFR